MEITSTMIRDAYRILGRFFSQRSAHKRHTTRHRLTAEPLEERMMLAADVEFRIEATDPAGTPISTVELGEEFRLNVLVQDVRTGEPESDLGAFAAYLDVLFDTSLVSVRVNGDPNDPIDFLDSFTFGDKYGNVPRAFNATDRMDNAGGMGGVGGAIGGDEFLLFSVPISAEATGHVHFVGAAADDNSPVPDPSFDVVLLNPPVAVPPENIAFGSTSLLVKKGFVPVAVDDPLFTVNEDGVLSPDAQQGVLSNDTDGDDDPLTAELDSSSQHGTLELHGDGSFTYTPNEDYHGPDSFTYHVNDGWQDSENSVTVNITVLSQPDAPVAQPDTYQVAQGAALLIDAAEGVLKNDTDSDGDGLNAVPVSSPAGGFLNTDGSFRYTPRPGFVGIDSFTYKATDGQLESPPTTVTIIVGTAASIDLSLVLQETETDVFGEIAALPEDEAWIDEWDSFWVEVWVSTLYTDDVGVRSASIDLTYNTQYFTATTIEPGPAFSKTPSGTIEDDAGRIVDLGGVSKWNGIGDDARVLLARVLFEPLEGDNVPSGPEGTYVAPVDNLGIDFTDAQVALDGIPSTNVVAGSLPDVPLWPVMYDIGDNGRIAFDNLAAFATAFGHQVDDAGVPYVYESDFDHSGTVGVGDLSFFATNFQLSRSDTDRTVYSANFPDDWQPAGLLAGASLGRPTTASPLSDEQLARIVDEAAGRLSAQFGSAAADELENVRVEIADLGGGLLGQAFSGTIVIDPTAADVGWFIDITPADDVEFSHLDASGERVATSDSAAANRIDLLSAVMHEMGHVLGLGHADAHDLMDPVLPPGTRRTLAAESSSSAEQTDADPLFDGLAWDAAVDELFATSGAGLL